VGRASPGEFVGPGGGVACMRDIFILNEIEAQVKYIFLARTLLG
jgi:hypothetical protein